ncbi:MAG: hypothetical protein JW767_03285 [Thermoleophilia bacterium]|nr:hypothetical protein [Thermoleophilia bacterium]
MLQQIRRRRLVPRVLAEIRVALREGITRDLQIGDICAKALTQLESSAAQAIGDARAALRVAAAENGVAVAGLSWASATATD